MKKMPSRSCFGSVRGAPRPRSHQPPLTFPRPVALDLISRVQGPVMARPCTRTLRLRSRETWAASSLKASWQTNRCGLLALRSKWRGPSRLITEEVSRHNPSNAFLCARRPKYQVMVDGDVEQSSSSSLSRIKDTDIRFGSCTASQPGLRVLFRDRPTVPPPHGHPQHRGHLRRRVPRSLLIDERGLITHHDQTNTRGCPSARIDSTRVPVPPLPGERFAQRGMLSGDAAQVCRPAAAPVGWPGRRGDCVRRRLP